MITFGVNRNSIGKIFFLLQLLQTRVSSGHCRRRLGDLEVAHRVGSILTPFRTEPENSLKIVNGTALSVRIEID